MKFYKMTCPHCGKDMAIRHGPSTLKVERLIREAGALGTSYSDLLRAVPGTTVELRGIVNSLIMHDKVVSVRVETSGRPREELFLREHAPEQQ